MYLVIDLNFSIVPNRTVPETYFSFTMASFPSYLAPFYTSYPTPLLSKVLLNTSWYFPGMDPSPCHSYRAIHLIKCPLIESRLLINNYYVCCKRTLSYLYTLSYCKVRVCTSTYKSTFSFARQVCRGWWASRRRRRRDVARRRVDE